MKVEGKTKRTRRPASVKVRKEVKQDYTSVPPPQEEEVSSVSEEPLKTRPEPLSLPEFSISQQDTESIPSPDYNPTEPSWIPMEQFQALKQKGMILDPTGTRFMDKDEPILLTTIEPEPVVETETETETEE